MIRQIFYYFFVLLFTCVNVLGNDHPPLEKSAENFVELLEKHDFWKRAKVLSTDRVLLPSLDSLKKLDSEFENIINYNLIKMHYGYQRYFSGYHHFVICELIYNDKQNIPNDSSLHTSRGNIFPLWKYKRLVDPEQTIRWEHHEYISWRAFRFNTSVYVIYTTPTRYMEKLNEVFSLLREYLSATNESDLDDFIIKLKENKKQSLIDYNTIQELQRMLEKANHSPDKIDGRWGKQTETALTGFLKSLGVTQSLSDLEDISAYLKIFQQENRIPMTGRCDSVTIEQLWKEYEKTLNKSELKKENEA